ncbi:MAG TPA: hypothetical protein VFW65_34695 [Pseudonocardiaceae bacterium]|nr:hypothetical protein [Pseudonocardiaceae bacterium]
MNIGDVMDELGTALETIDGLKVFPYYADRLVPPAAVLAWPDPLAYDDTMVRGSDRVTLHLFVMVGRFDARTTRDRLSQYLDGSGDASVKAAVEGGTYTALDTVRVVQATVDSYTSAGVELLGADFELDIYGRGA